MSAAPPAEDALELPKEPIVQRSGDYERVMKSDYDALRRVAEGLKERVIEVQAEAFDKIMAAEQRCAALERLLGEVRGRWEWSGPSRKENFESMLGEIQRILAARAADKPPAPPATGTEGTT